MTTAAQPVREQNGAAPGLALAKFERKETPLTMEQTFALAEKLVPTGFLPEHIKKPGHAVAIILAGQELGMPPMRALRSLRMVKGNVTESADSQLARFKSDGGRAQFKQLDEKVAVLFLRHPNGDEHEETFTIEDARKAGLLNNQQYAKYPKAMLRSRAITAGLKSIGWEGGAGNYDPSELEIPTTATATVVASAGSGSVDDGRAGIADADGVEITPDPLALPPAERLAWAKAYPWPFNVGKPQHGKPLDTISVEHMESVAKWILDKQKEKEDSEWHADTLLAMRVLRDEREKEQTKLPLETSNASAPAAPSTKAGNVGDALTPKAAGAPASDEDDEDDELPF